MDADRDDLILATDAELYACIIWCVFILAAAVAITGGIAYGIFRALRWLFS